MPPGVKKREYGTKKTMKFSLAVRHTQGKIKLRFFLQISFLGATTDESCIHVSEDLK